MQTMARTVQSSGQSLPTQPTQPANVASAQTAQRSHSTPPLAPLMSPHTMGSQSMAPSPRRPSLSAQTASKQSSGRITSTSTAIVSRVCLSSFSSSLLLRREDVSAAIFHSWLFFMSATALMTESIPHIWASFALHVIALFWSSFQMWATQKFSGDYQYIITGPQGACPGIDLISDYFTERRTFQIATTVVNFVSTLVSAYLCWRLFGVSIIHFCGVTARLNTPYCLSDVWVANIQEDGRQPHDCTCL